MRSFNVCIRRFLYSGCEQYSPLSVYSNTFSQGIRLSVRC